MEQAVGDGTGQDTAQVSAPRRAEDDQARVLLFGEVVQRARGKAGGRNDGGRNGDTSARRVLHESAEATHRRLRVLAESAGELWIDTVDVQVDGVCAREQKRPPSQPRKHEAQCRGRCVLAERVDGGDDGLLHTTSVALSPPGNHGCVHADGRRRASIRASATRLGLRRGKEQAPRPVAAARAGDLGGA